MDERDDGGESPYPDEPGGEPGRQPRASRSEDALDDSGDATNAAPGVTGSGREGSPRCVPEDDFDADAEMARWVADIEAGRERIPEEWERDGSAISLSLGDACDLDPALLAAMLGPDGLGGQSLGPAFAQGQAADALRPGPVLAALTEQAVSDAAGLSDDELTGALQANRRLGNRDAYKQTVLVAEFARRREAAFAGAKARGVRPGRRPGEFAADELASELVCTASYAGVRLERDAALTSRLPMTLAGMAAGAISEDRADLVAAWTASLSDADAARADEILAAAAPGLRYDQLSRKAAALEMKLNPEGVKARKEHAKQTRQRVEVRREDTGNASIAGRELDTVDVLGCKSYIDTVAVRIRNHGHADGGLDAIRARVMTELLQGRNPLDLLKPRPGPAAGQGDAPPSGAAPDGDDDRADNGGTRASGTERAGAAPFGGAFRDPDDPGPDYPGDLSDPDDADDDDDADCGDPLPGYAGPGGAPAWSAEEAENARHVEPDDPAERRGPLHPTQSAPPPANLNLIIPIGTLLGWSAAPAQAGGFGLLDPEETRALVAAASRHPRTRWSITLADPQGRAIAHGRARGQHPWEPPPQATTPPKTSPPTTSPPTTSPPTTSSPATSLPGTQSPPPPNPQDGSSPNADQAARLRHLIQALGIIFDPIAQGTCDHRQAESRYTPSRKLKDLIRARTITCDAPGCGAQAVYCDLDHTTAWPDGPTDQCNLGPKCRRHHRCKQAPGWHVEQSEPGVTRWSLPNGRSHTTEPTTYDC